MIRIGISEVCWCLVAVTPLSDLVSVDRSGRRNHTIKNLDRFLNFYIVLISNIFYSISGLVHGRGSMSQMLDREVGDGWIASQDDPRGDEKKYFIKTLIMTFLMAAIWKFNDFDSTAEVVGSFGCGSFRCLLCPLNRWCP